MKSVSVQELVDEFELEILAGAEGLNREIVTDELHRPGLEFTGYLDFFPRKSVQVLGVTEITYLKRLKMSEKLERISAVVSQKPPCFIVARDQDGLETFITCCKKEGVCLLRTKEMTTKFISKVNDFLTKKLAEEMTIHGVCVNVFGIGILLTGESGIGKSEVALALVGKGHRLISDDAVVLKKLNEKTIVGTHDGANKGYLALRGLGLSSISRIFGVSASQEETKILLHIKLEPWAEGTYYNQLEFATEQVTYMGVTVRSLTIPVRPGRDIASLIEVAARNWSLEEQGYNAFSELQNRLLDGK